MNNPSLFVLIKVFLNLNMGTHGDPAPDLAVGPMDIL